MTMAPGGSQPMHLVLVSTPIGHLDPLYVELMAEVQELLRYAWQTDNRLTLPMSGTGSAAMEATLANTVEPGDRVLVAVKGYFGNRLVDMAGRYRADVRVVEKPWGEAFTLEELEAALIEHKPAILALVHAETSTGICQPMDGIGDLCRQHNCLLLLDTVTSLGGVPLFLDEWKVDLAYSCSQKGLSCPPGLGPFTMGPRAEEKLAARKDKVPNWYLDVSLLNQYWGSDRVYHHTAPVNMNFGMREALRLLAEEGLEQAWARHRRNAEARDRLLMSAMTRSCRVLSVLESVTKSRQESKQRSINKLDSLATTRRRICRSLRESFIQSCHRIQALAAVRYLIRPMARLPTLRSLRVSV
mgnify:CR=1 FL=1